MQAMYDYGNNTAQIVENFQAAINSAKQSSDYWTAEHLEQMQQQTVSSSAQTVGQLAEAGRSSNAQTTTTRENTDSKQVNVGGELSGEWTNKKDQRRR